MHVIDDRPNSAKFNELVDITKELMVQKHVPGVSIGIVLGEEEFTAGLGITSVVNPLPVTPDTLFNIGSTNKTITTAAIFILIEQGKLRLDDPVRNFIPGFKVSDKDTSVRVTIRHLLNHTSGWMGDFELDTGEGDDALQKLIESMSNLPQFTPLGELFTYNNIGFSVAGRIIEIITGQTYEAAMQEMVLAPLQMNHSFYFPHEVILHRFAVGHTYREDEMKISKTWSMPRSNAPCGGRLNSSIPDQLRYARLHLGNVFLPKEKPLIKASSLKMRQTPSVTTDEGGWMGLNWFIKDINGIRFFEHGGSSNGQQSAFCFCPEKHFAMTVFTNEVEGYTLHMRLTDWVQNHMLGIINEEPEPIALSSAQVNAYIGIYYLRAHNFTFEVKESQGGFILIQIPSGEENDEESVLPPMECSFYSRDKFIFQSEPFKGLKGDFIKNKNGKITWLRFSGRVFGRL